MMSWYFVIPLVIVNFLAFIQILYIIIGLNHFTTKKEFLESLIPFYPLYVMAKEFWDDLK